MVELNGNEGINAKYKQERKPHRGKEGGTVVLRT